MGFILDVLGGVFTVFFLVITISVSLLISQPLTGALVRLRANYLPKALSLDSVLEDGSTNLGSGANPRAISAYFLRDARAAAKIGPVVNGVWGMLQRTYRLEGWSGIYRGSAPVAIQLMSLGFIAGVIFNTGAISASGGAYRSAPASPDKFGFWGNLFFMALVAIVTLPMSVITTRTIVHPRALPMTTPMRNLRELLSPSEYAQPWRLFQVPGLLAATLLHVSWVGLATRLVRYLTVPALGGLPPVKPAAPDDQYFSGPTDESLKVGALGLAIFLAWNVASTLILSPVEIVIVRLAVQRPESQQPLHMAFAPRANGNAPNSFSHHNASQRSDNYRDGSNAPDKPLPQQPSDAAEPAPRPSFAIEDEEEDEGASEAPRSNGSGHAYRDTEDEPVKPTQANHESARPASVAGAAFAREQAPFLPTSSDHLSQQREPIIALRPCDQPLTASAAQEAAEQGFGAPVVERYEGFVDCLNKLVDEEGVEALYRGAIITLLGTLVGSFGG
ncbi:hypothetical protein IE81DRAFT_324008 [Ceraceosorus guamensis]|uniref:Mitochondrial carrier n=1 Tax=Ceraceosorus guamensis TaxID=1522189 RepID=A0A316VWI6_9BASI|nr:hypothetical protein IE81DRAFT_324008 [Ceraceosorus guamensis]PWN42007.1 hypothetical protein IE81DRAFT_324008 [Ceraceosorus guamensis]